MGKKRICTNCKSKNLQISDLLKGVSASCSLFTHVVMYVCQDCGHIELYKTEKAVNSIKKSNWIID